MRIPRFTYSSVTATVALFLALGGSSYAALQIGGADVRNGSLTGSDVRNESIKSRDLDNGTVTGGDLKNGSVAASDIKDASLLAADFKAGELPAGPQGIQGPQGPGGPQGPAGATNVVTRRVQENVPSGQFREPEVSCLSGETVVGGGAGITGQFNLIYETRPIESDGSAPEDGEVSTGWYARGLNSSGVAQTMNVFVLCASP